MRPSVPGSVCLRRVLLVAVAAVALTWASVVSAQAAPTDPPPDDPNAGLYVIVEASTRPLDQMLLLPTVCQASKAQCDLIDQVLFNDTRLSGLLRPARGTAAQAAAMTKAPLPNFVLKPSASAGSGAVWIMATMLRPAKVAGQLELVIAVAAAKDGKPLDLGDWAHQLGPDTSLRYVAHRVLNAVQGALTGIEGSFDTVVYYSAPAPGCNRAIWQVDVDGYNRRVLVADTGPNGIHLLPVQLQDSALAYTSFRSGLPSLYKLDAAQIAILTEMTPTVAKGLKLKKSSTGTATQPAEKVAPPGPFASGKDLQFHGCAQSPRGEIVSTVNDGEQSDIFVVDYTGAPGRNLTHDEHDDLSPSFSPDGEKVAFVSDRKGTPQVYVMDGDGSNVRRLTFVGPYNTDPEWGPDGRIAYSSLRGNAIDILTIDLNGKAQRLTPGQGRRSLEPTWSPDGKRLIYVSNEDGKCTRLWVTSADGAAREPLDVPCDRSYNTPSWQRIPGQGPRKWQAHRTQ